MKTRTILCLTVIINLAFFLSISTPAEAASAEDEALQTMANWFKAFNTNDYDLMASLWWQSPKTTSFGPWKESPFLNQGWEGMSADWKTSFDVPPGSYMNTMHHPQVTLLGDDVAIITNYNNFVYTDQATKEQTTGQVRGTFVIQKIGGRWLIVHEHSSVLPTE